jgi:opacity protein-like surface antigen
MADPTVVLLILVAGAASEPSRGTSVASGVREALGSETRVLVEERRAAPTDAEAREDAERLAAAAVADVRWIDRQSRALVHVFVAADRAAYDRDLTFTPADALEERERAVGLLVGAMVRAAAAADVKPPPRPPEALGVAPAAEQPAPRAVPAVRDRNVALELGATSAVPVAGDGRGFGPSLGAQLYVLPSLAIRTTAGARFGPLAGADADTTTLRFGAGLSFRALGRRERDTFALSVSLEGVVLNHAVSRSAPTARQDRWVTGTFASASVGWRLSGTLEPFAAVGIETAFGTTPVVIDRETRATIPLFRVATDLGMRFRF